MKVVGLITEYNPFHNGHAYHIQQAKNLCAADYCIVIMSGNFVQRGEPAILDKFARTQMALSCGADLVLELPVLYATGSAEYFADGAVALLNSLGIIDYLCFGSESGDIHALSAAAHILADEPNDFRLALRDILSQGIGFPAARQKALDLFSPGSANLLESPNNILGIEYLKSLYRSKSTIKPLTITRKGAGYHETEPDDSFSSATSIRRIVNAPPSLLRNLSDPAKLLTPLETQMPTAAFKILKSAFGSSCPVTLNDFSEILHYRLLQFTSARELDVFFDLSKDLADRIFRAIPTYRNYEDFILQLKTKHFTDGRIRRCLLHILLGIRTTVSLKPQYLRVLGFKKESSPLLTALSRNTSLPLITKLANAADLLDASALEMLNLDIFAAHVYQGIITKKYAGGPYREYSRQLVIL